MKLLKDILTGSGGETYAIGRVLSAAMFAGGTPPPVVIGLWTAWQARHGSIPLAEWGSFLAATAAYYAALVGSITALVRITDSTEPKA
jgi:hypothetical protein